MKNMLKIGLVILVSVSFSCSTKSQSTMYKDTSKAKKLLEQFNQQEHRLEINDCEVRYNGKAFFLGSTLEEVEAILGKPDFTHPKGAMWSKSHLDARIDESTNEINSIYIYIDDSYEEIIKENSNIILMNGIPLSKEMTMGDFINNSTYEFSDFNIKRSFTLNPSKCPIKEVRISFISNPIFNYSGGGHLQMRGDFNPKETFPVKRINIYKSLK